MKCLSSTKVDNKSGEGEVITAVADVSAETTDVTALLVSVCSVTVAEAVAM